MPSVWPVWLEPTVESALFFPNNLKWVRPDIKGPSRMGLSQRHCDPRHKTFWLCSSLTLSLSHWISLFLTVSRVLPSSVGLLPMLLFYHADLFSTWEQDHLFHSLSLEKSVPMEGILPGRPSSQINLADSSSLKTQLKLSFAVKSSVAFHHSAEMDEPTHCIVHLLCLHCFLTRQWIYRVHISKVK